MRSFPATLVFLAAISMFGCAADPREKMGRTWYIDGAGNWGFGVLDVPLGLQDGGYKGLVTNHPWSLTFNPALDQTLRFIARGSGEGLGREITAYLKKYPNAEANIIALSAGTGVGMWAIENVQPPCKVNNYILLGSSISSKYNVNQALKNMKGKIYVFYSASDPVLQGPVRALGTIDGTFDDSAGLVGLHGSGASSDRVVNIARRSEHATYGWTGGHADCTNRQFVARYLSKIVVTLPKPATVPPPSAEPNPEEPPKTAAVPPGQGPT